MKRNANFLPKELLFLFFLLLIGVGISIWIYLPSGQKGTLVQVMTDGKETAVYRLDTNRTIELTNGSDFHNTLKIENHTATIISANCRDQLCVYHKSISSPGESIICLPHKLSITIIGGNESVPDGISG